MGKNKTGNIRQSLSGRRKRHPLQLLRAAPRKILQQDTLNDARHIQHPERPHPRDELHMGNTGQRRQIQHPMARRQRDGHIHIPQVRHNNQRELQRKSGLSLRKTKAKNNHRIPAGHTDPAIHPLRNGAPLLAQRILRQAKAEMDGRRKKPGRGIRKHPKGIWRRAETPWQN